jgi:predicted nucleotidyltransferase
MITRFSFLAVLILLLDDALKLLESFSEESPASAVKFMLIRRLLEGRALGKASEEAHLYKTSEQTQNPLDDSELSETDREEIMDLQEAMKRDADGIQYLRREYYNAYSFLDAVAEVKFDSLD